MNFDASSVFVRSSVHGPAEDRTALSMLLLLLEVRRGSFAVACVRSTAANCCMIVILISGLTGYLSLNILHTSFDHYTDLSILFDVVPLVKLISV